MHTRTAVASPLKKRMFHSRRIHFVDIENLLGGAVQHPDDAEWAWSQIESQLGPISQDQIVLGTSRFSAPNCLGSWDSARRVWRSGRDGADLCLMKEMSPEYIAGLFGQVVLASGDGIFVEAVSALQAVGVHVTVIAPAKGCSKRLQLVANKVYFVDFLYENIGGAA